MSQAPRKTKGQVITELVGQLERVLVEEKILSYDNVDMLKDMYGLSNEKIVAVIEQWVLPKYREGILKQWLLSEFELAHKSAESISGEKITNIAGENNVKAEHLAMAIQSAKEGVLNNKQLFNKVYTRLNKICYVLDYKPERKTAVQ